TPLVSGPMTAPALARAVVTMTEAKSAALQRLAVPSCYSADLATGTGTDQFCVAAPMAGERPLTSASPHVRAGRGQRSLSSHRCGHAELIGAGARRQVRRVATWNGQPLERRALRFRHGHHSTRERRRGHRTADERR